METSETASHLGGHLNRTNIDEGALNFLIEKYQPTSFLDIGCGPAGMVQLAKEKKLDAVGIDGDKKIINDLIIEHDFTKAPILLDKTYDIGWSVEFVEHVYADYIQNYMSALKQCDTIMLTYAPPGTPGHHHVNLQDAPYWIDSFESHYFIYDHDTTIQLRNASTMNINKKNPMKRFVYHHGLVFHNTHHTPNMRRI